MEIYRKIRVWVQFCNVKKFYDMLKNGIFCELVILMIFCKNLIC